MLPFVARIGIVANSDRLRLVLEWIDHLDLLEAVGRFELRRDRAAEGSSGRGRRLPDVHVERARLVAVERQLDLRFELRCRAVDVRRSRRLLHQLVYLVGVLRRVAALHVGHELVDRLGVPAARTGRRDHDDLRVRQRLRGELAVLVHPVDRIVFAIVFEPDVNLTDVAGDEEAAER